MEPVQTADLRWRHNILDAQPMEKVRPFVLLTRAARKHLAEQSPNETLARSAGLYGAIHEPRVPLEVKQSGFDVDSRLNRLGVSPGKARGRPTPHLRRPKPDDTQMVRYGYICSPASGL